MLSWTLFWVKIWRGAITLQGQPAIDYVKEHTKGLMEPLQSAIDWTPDGSRCNADEMKYWVASPWDNHGGRVTIVGDAAHPMLPCEFDRNLSGNNLFAMSTCALNVG
jgi:hypothetical protein